MGHKIEENFIQGVKTLEDLYALGGLEFFHLLDRVHHHLSEIKREAQESVDGLKNFQQIGKFLENEIDRMVNTFFRESHIRNQFQYERKVVNLSLRKWNLILEIMPDIFKLTQLFQFQKEIHFKITDQYIELKSQISAKDPLEEKRNRAYKITRSLLRSKCLLTFDLPESSPFEGEMFYMSFKVNYSHLDNAVYACHVNDEILLGFSNIFSQYRINPRETLRSGSHLCLSIQEDGIIEKKKNLPQFCLQNSFEGEIFYFSFLFRPISIIMKRRGKLFSRTCLDDYIGTSKGKQKIKYLGVDFFSIFNS